MNAILARWLGTAATLGATALLCPGLCTGSGVLWGSVMLTVLYVLIRPLTQTVALPFNLFLGGLLTPLTDALLIWWTSAWVSGLAVGYWQCVALALVISAAYAPYAASRRSRLTRPV